MYVCNRYTTNRMYIFISVQNAVPIRGDPHILIVGDPGLGKSQVSVCLYYNHTNRIAKIKKEIGINYVHMYVYTESKKKQAKNTEQEMA